MSVASPSGGGFQLEDFQVEYVGPLIGLILSVVIYYCCNHLERLPEVGLLESLVVSIVVALLVIAMLYLHTILYKTFTNKFYASVVIILMFPTIFVLSKPAWKIFVYFNGTTPSNAEGSSSITTPVDELSRLIQQDGSYKSEHLVSKHIQGMEKSSSSSEESLKTRTSDLLSSNEEPYFEGDCIKYSKLLLATAILTVPKQYHVKGQVEMFKITVYLTGKPSVLALTRKPKEYLGTAMDVMGDRHHNTEAHSRESAEDAIEKALIKICEIFKTKGFYIHS